MMMIGGVTELLFGVPAEGEALESIAKPLTVEEGRLPSPAATPARQGRCRKDGSCSRELGLRAVGSAGAVSVQPPARFGDLAFGLLARAPALDHDVGPVLELLVDREETARSPRGAAAGPRAVRGGSSMGPRAARRSPCGRFPLLVAHPEHADRLDRDQAAGERRLVQAHERVERVAVEAQRAAQVAVVGREVAALLSSRSNLIPPRSGSYSYLLREPFGLRRTQTRSGCGSLVSGGVTPPTYRADGCSPLFRVGPAG